MKFNELDPNVHEILVILGEEAAEVIQETSKTIRFGLDDVRLNNLEKEIGDLLAMIDLLESHGVIDSTRLETAKNAKIVKLKQWSSIFN
jgi:NTP pyrophosphatase (non-canonical NTP hydrolase)